MDQARSVRGVERAGQLAHERYRLRRRKGARAAIDATKISPVDEPHVEV